MAHLSSEELTEILRDVRQAADAFHAHLDVCEQCEQHPFDLCERGLQLFAAIPGTRSGRVPARLYDKRK